MVAVATLDGIRRTVGHTNWQVTLARQVALGINAKERDIFRLHVGDVDRLPVRRHHDALRRDAASELETGRRQDLRWRRGCLVDTEHFNLVRMYLADEQKIASNGNLLGAAAA